MGTEVGAGVDGEVLRVLSGNTPEARWGQMMRGIVLMGYGG